MRQRGRPRKFNREETLRNAMLTFWQHGYDNTSMSDLVTSMGINTPSIYSTFGSKEALFKEVVTLYRETEGSKIWQKTMQETSAKSAIETFLTLSAQEFTQLQKPKGCLVVLGAIYHDNSNGMAYQLLQKLRTESIDNLASLLKRDIEHDILKPTIDYNAIATYYVTVQQGMSIQARDGASQEDLRAVAQCALATWSILTK